MTYNYFVGNRDKEFNIKEMKKYLHTKQELDKLLFKIITPYIKNKTLDILDACCGIGHLSYFLSRISPNSNFYGLDQSRYLIKEARQMFENYDKLHFKSGDVYKLPKTNQKRFDISINWKTLSWLPYYEEMMKTLFKVTKHHIFLSSLFYDGDIDFEIKVTEYKKQIGETKHPRYYNVYSLPKFQKFVYDLGAKNIQIYDFQISKTLPKPSLNQMGTYTETLSNGEKLQISGVIVMTWKIIRIDL